MLQLQVCLFGKCSIVCGDRELAYAESSKAQELLCYLLYHRGRPHSREALSGLFWGECSGSLARKYLRQTLWQIQGQVEAVHSDLASLLQLESDWVRVAPGASIWIDTEQFERAVAITHGVSGHSCSPAQVQSLRSAVELYRGDLLEGWYQDWCLYERERLQNIYLLVLDKLMAHCEVSRAYEAGLTFGASILRYDRARERTHRQLMRLYYLAGDRTGALRQYKRCCEALEEELDVGPSQQTEQLYKQICADLFDVVPSPAHMLPPPQSPESRNLPDVLAHLRRLCEELSQVQYYLRDDIAAMENALGPQQHS